MTINKTQKTMLSTVTATEAERQVLRDLYNACVEVSEDGDVYEDVETIFSETVANLIRTGKSDFSNYYDI